MSLFFPALDDARRPGLTHDASAARLTVDLDALGANHALLLKEARGAEIAPVVKADAYGLGAISAPRASFSSSA